MIGIIGFENQKLYHFMHITLMRYLIIIETIFYILYVSWQYDVTI